MKFILVVISLNYLVNQKIVVTSMSSPKVKTIEQDESLMEFADLRGLKLNKYNRTTLALSGKLIFFKEFTDIKLNFGISKKLGNGYVQTSIINIQNQDICDIIHNPKLQEMFIKDMFEHSNIPNDCHIMPGEYKFTNYVPVVPDNMPPGEYRSDATFFQNGKPVLRYKLFSSA